MSFGMPRHHMDFASIYRHVVVAVDNDLRIRLRLQFQPMDDPLCAEMMGIPVCIADIVTVGQQDVLDTTEVAEFLGKYW